MMTVEELTNEIRVADLGTLQSLLAVVQEQIAARLSPDGVRAELAAISTNADTEEREKLERLGAR